MKLVPDNQDLSDLQQYRGLCQSKAAPREQDGHLQPAPQPPRHNNHDDGVKAEDGGANAGKEP